MSYSAAITADADSPTEDWAADHVRMLRELAELGMALARSVAAQALAPADGPEAGPGRADPGLAFSRIARTVRLTLALEARTREGAIARPTPGIGYPEIAAAAERVRAKLGALMAPEPLSPQEAEIHRVVEQALETEHPDAEALDDLMDDIFDRLKRDVAYAGYRDRPIGAVVARLCQDLGVTPDWSRWAAEPWAVEEARNRARGSPYAPAAP